MDARRRHRGVWGGRGDYTYVCVLCVCVCVCTSSQPRALCTYNLNQMSIPNNSSNRPPWEDCPKTNSKVAANHGQRIKGQAATSLAQRVLFMLLANTPTEHPTSQGSNPLEQGLSFFWGSRAEQVPRPCSGFPASTAQAQVICYSSCSFPSQMWQNCGV